jgi:hypothetical protein
MIAVEQFQKASKINGTKMVEINWKAKGQIEILAVPLGNFSEKYPICCNGQDLLFNSNRQFNDKNKIYFYSPTKCKIGIYYFTGL